MLDHDLADQFLDYFDRLLQFYTGFLNLEKEKYEGLLNNHLSLLDGQLKKEQAFVLKARGLEHEREVLMEKTQTPGAVFRDMIPQFESGKREKMQKLYDDLSRTLLQLQKISEKANSLTQVKMQKAKRTVQELQHNPELKKIYDQTLSVKDHPSSVFSKKV